MNIQVQQMSRGKMRPDVKRAIEIAVSLKNLETRVHLKYVASDTWVLFDLQKSHSITGFRIYPAWSNGPKKVKIRICDESLVHLLMLQSLM